MFDAAVEIAPGDYLFFQGDMAHAYNWSNKGQGGPFTITTRFDDAPLFPAAAVRGQGSRSHYLYLFGPTHYWCYNLNDNSRRPDTPLPIRRNWRGVLEKLDVGADQLSGAVTLPDGRIMFFGRTTCIPYDFERGETLADRAMPIRDAFPGFTITEFDCVLRGSGGSSGKLYFFKGDRYWRYDLAGQATDRGYPKPIADVWTGMSWPIPNSCYAALRPTRLMRGQSWQKFDADDLMQGTLDRLRNPYLIAQQLTPMCGQAAILYAMADRFPYHYADLMAQAMGVLNPGQIKGRTETFEADDKLRTLNVPRRSQIAPVDWVPSAILRDALNALNALTTVTDRRFLGTQNIPNGITTMSEVEYMADQLFPPGRVVLKRAYGADFDDGDDKINAIRLADQAQRAGGVALLMVNSNLVHSRGSRLRIPTHWIVYEGGLTITAGRRPRVRWDDTFAFNCYSWGNSYAISTDGRRFAKQFFGTVAWFPT